MSSILGRLKNKIVNELEKELETVRLGIGKAKQDAIDAPGRMQARYDTTKQESSYLFNTLSARGKELEKAIEKIKKFDAPIDDKIGIGTLAIIELDNVSKNILILPVAGGKIISDEQLGEIAIINPSAPIFEFIKSARVGDVVQFNDKQIRIIKILQ